MKLAQVNIKNRRATFDFDIIDTYVAGIVLTGTEIKSIRLGKAGLTDSFCYENNGEIWIKNMYIGEYFYGSYNNHSSRRDRKLLLNKKEINELGKASKDNGFSIIPLKVFVNDRGLAKVQIALAKGKKAYDKRQSIKEREDKREMDRMFKHKSLFFCRVVIFFLRDQWLWRICRRCRLSLFLSVCIIHRATMGNSGRRYLRGRWFYSVFLYQLSTA